MLTNRKISRNSVARVAFTLASTLLVAVFLLVIFKPAANTGEVDRGISSTARTGEPTATKPVQQAQDILSSVTPFRSMLISPVETSKNEIASNTTIPQSDNTAAQTNNATGSTARPPQNGSPIIEVPSLTKSATTKKIASIVSAENQVYTSDNRLFVTGRDGIFEIIANPDGTIGTVERAPKQSCDFGGITEAAGTLYANCSGNGAAYIYAAKVNNNLSFKRIFTYKKWVILPNGITADASGRIYVAATFLGQILRLTPSPTDTLTFANTEVWRGGTGFATNGIKFFDNSIFWTDSVFVNRIVINADGKYGKQTRVLQAALTVLDDLAVNSNGILVADYLKGVIRSYDINGRSTGTVQAHFSGPSSVAWARAPFPVGSIIVTERSGNKVTLVTP